ncbi:MAG TPA: leucyl aminopeptidase [Bacteroidales bacterium]|nr:leucyl aminopeptidase [Bacteroidales bacterium]
MSPVIERVAQLSVDQSVVCVIGSDTMPPKLKLDGLEKEYIKRCLADKEDVITVNSYQRIACIVRERVDLEPVKRDEELRKAGIRVLEKLKQHKQLSVALMSHQTSVNGLYNLAEGLILGCYQFSKYKSETKKDNYSVYPEKVLIYDKETLDVDRLRTITEAVYFTRDLVNEPVNYLNAGMFARRMTEFVHQAGVTTEIYSKRKIEALKMGGLLAVNRGSPDPPTFTVMEWRPESPVNNKAIVLVGKGVVFDTGGLNLKPTDYIEEMKSDMAGGAIAAAVIYVIARLKLSYHLIALVPATDNRPGMSAFAPGDVITMFNGKTVEIQNTDAEGRLILADALSYAEKFKPELIISIATLTGSAANAFGNQAIAVMGNAPDHFFRLLEEAGLSQYERVARMPFFDEYAELLKSDIADLKNIGGKEAGAITAGKFLENFVESSFIHLDIAGVSMLKKDDHYRLKGGSGTGVRLLVSLLTRLSEEGENNKRKT